MGHTRLGELPRTLKWQEVVELMGLGASAGQIATAVINAAARGMALTTDHRALVEAFLLLAQIPQAARQPDFAAALRDIGLDVPDRPGTMDIAAALSETVDARLPNNVGRTDLGELAQMAAVETLIQVVTERTEGFFGSTPDHTRDALARLATVKQFGELGRAFFGRLTDRILQYYVSRVTPSHIGEGERFATLAATAEFDHALTRHSHEAAKIVEEYAGGWFAKNRKDQGIQREQAQKFVSYAMQKVVDELRAGAR